MDATADELAGVVSLFGGLTRAELERALSEVAFRADGQSVDGSALEDALEDALRRFALVRYHPSDADGGSGDPGIGDVDGPLFVPGPTAFPRTPDAAEDVPHILDIEPRSIDRERLGAQTRERFDRAVEAAIDAADADRAAHLIDASYDLEAWAPIDLADARERLAVVEADSADVIVEADSADAMVEADSADAIEDDDSSTDEPTPDDERDEPPADATTE